MDTDKVNTALYNKMAAEQKGFRDWLLKQPPEEILNRACEYAVREDILMAMEDLNLPSRQASALLESPAPLADVYKDYCKLETGQMEDLQGCIEARADSALETQKEAARAIPLYRESFEYASTHNEIAMFRASCQANRECRLAIESAIRQGFDGTRLADDIEKGVLEQFGAERVSCILAVTLCEKRYDGRFSRNNLTWAASVPQFDISDRRSFIVDSHPGLLDIFVMSARKAMEAMREQPQKNKPSIKEQLTAKPILGDKPAAKSKDREVR